MANEKGAKVLFMPERSGEQLASAVAKALRSAGQYAQTSPAATDASGSLSNAIEVEVVEEAAANHADEASEIDVVEEVDEGEEMSSAELAELKRDAEEDTLEGDAVDGDAGGLRYLAVKDIKASPYQTRERINERELDGLVQSIEQRGVIQPIIVRSAMENGRGRKRFELVAGERRLRAATRAGLKRIPAIVQEVSNQEALELAIIENAQREDLNPIEEAIAFKRLAEEFKLSQSDIADAVGKNRATISNALRLLQLEPEVITLLRAGKLSAGHGRALLGVTDPARQVRLAERIVADGLPVRALERMVNRVRADAEELDEEEERFRASIERARNRVADYLDMEEGVSLKVDAEGRRRLNLVFETEAAWRRFVSKIRD